MMKMRLLLIPLPLLFLNTTLAGELGIGRENDIPDATPPAEPAPDEAPSSLLQEFLEWFDMEVEQ